jgi:hypothetical protein
MAFFGLRKKFVNHENPKLKKEKKKHTMVGPFD